MLVLKGLSLQWEPACDRTSQHVSEAAKTVEVAQQSNLASGRNPAHEDTNGKSLL